MMKKIFVLILFLSVILSSCARYRATQLSSLSPDIIYEKPANFGVIVAAKAFTKLECKKYLDRDVIKKGYQPIQLYIQNVTDQSYFFSTSRVSLPLASPEEVAQKVHTSTVGRIAGYSAAALIASPLFVIPAIVDGVKSSSANENLDNDFASKAAKDQVIFPHSHVNMLLFVPREDYQETFTVTLLEESTHRPVRFFANVR